MPDLYPLDKFQEAPEVMWIPGEEVPAPENGLLVHDGDMTLKLRDFHGSKIALEVLTLQHDSESYLREVLLQANSKVVEYGAIEIRLGVFEERVRARILRGGTPLGGLLNEEKIGHYSRPQGFFRLAGSSMEHFFRRGLPEKVYGRRNTLLTDSDEVIAEIVEIVAT